MPEDERTTPGARVRIERRARGWDKPEMARRLAAAMTGSRPSRTTLISYIKRWEAGKTGISERYRLVYATAFGLEEADLFPAKYSREAFLSRTKSQLAKPGFALVTASERQALVGFAFGFQMGPGAWWANATPLPPEISRASKFAVIELLVDARHRGSGIGRELAEQLLAERDEEYATLAARREAPAHGMYLRWGWKPVGRFSTPPYSDVMIVSLAARR